MDPENHNRWMHYHLQKCYTPYQDGVGCIVNVQDKEIQKMKKEAGPKGWELVKEKFIQDHAKKVGGREAKRLWEMSTNLKEIHEKSRQQYGHLYGEAKSPTNNNQSDQTYMEVEQMLAAVKRRELDETMQKKKKSFWGFGS